MTTALALPAIPLDDTTFLEQQQADLEQQTQHLKSRIGQFDYAIRRQYQDLFTLSHTLQQKVSDLQGEINELTQPPQAAPADAPGGPKVHVAGDIPMDDMDPVEDAPPPPDAPDKLRAKCSKVFKKIARRCHPDKTKDKALHEVFIRAKEYLNALDLPALREILHLLQQGVKFRVKPRREELEEKIKELSDQLFYLLQSEAYKLAQMWEEHPGMAASIVLSGLQNQIQQLQRQIMQLAMTLDFIKRNPFA